MNLIRRPVHPRIQRRRALAASLNIPAGLEEKFAKFTGGELAVLKIISGKVVRDGACTLPQDAIADLSSITRRVVMITLRTAIAEGLIKIEQGIAVIGIHWMDLLKAKITSLDFHGSESP
jgi:hypothetical protein